MSDNPAPAKSWSLFGAVKKPAKPLWALLAVSLVVAFETFLERQPPYPAYMSLGVIAVTVWLAVHALTKRALIGFVGVLLALPWVGQLFGAGWMDSSVVVFFLSHSLFAVWVAVAAYTFMARSPST